MSRNPELRTPNLITVQNLLATYAGQSDSVMRTLLRVVDTYAAVHPNGTLSQLEEFLSHEHAKRVSGGTSSLAEQAHGVVLIHRSQRSLMTGFLGCFPLLKEAGIKAPKDLATLIRRALP